MSDFLRPTDCTVHGILQARVLEWVAVPFSKGSSQPRDWTQVSRIAGGFPFSSRSSCPRIQPGVSCIVGRFFTNWAIRDFKKERTLRINYVCKITKQIKELRFKFRPFLKENRSVMTLCDPVDYTVHEILQARILEWVAFPFSRGSSQPSDQIRVFHIAGGFFISWAPREALILILIL